MAMTQDEVREWALAHGFAPAESGQGLSAPWGRLRFDMVFGRKNVRISVTDGERSETMISFDPRSHAIRVGDSGIIEGAGLGHSFVTRFRLVERDDLPPPPWMSEDFGYREA